MSQQAIPGYTYGTSAVPHSPLSLEDFERLKQTVLFSDEDSGALRRSYDILQDQVEAILDVWYGFVASHPFLVHFFSDRAIGQPDGAYLAAVRKRFGQWILDTAKADYDQAWLNYQYEIGLRHSRAGKNRTDGVNSVDHVSYRYLPALLYPVTTTLKPFLAKKGHSAEEVEKMHQAWLKSVLLQVILWSQPYVKDGEF
jgi:Protoglobin